MAPPTTRKPANSLFELLVANANGHLDKLIDPRKILLLQEGQPATTSGHFAFDEACVRL